nr:hypothetical protein [Tanacetum cinerariifolium]
KEVTILYELLKYCIIMLDKADVDVRDLVDLIRELVILIDTEAASSKAAPEREKKSTQEIKELEIKVPDPVQGEHQPPVVINMPLDQFIDSLFNTSSSEFSLTLPLIIANKGKGTATEEYLVNQLMPFIEQGGSAPKIPNLLQFSLFVKKMTLEEVIAQMEEIKRLELLKSEKEKSVKRLKALADEELDA